MTVIYFLYLFEFIKMLPPKDLGSVLPKLQEMEPAGPLPHHPALSTTVPLPKGKLPLSMCHAGNCFPSFPISGHRDSPLAFLEPPGKDFLGSPWGSSLCTLDRHRGNWALRAEGMDKGRTLGQGYGDFSIQLPTENKGGDTD